MQMALRSSTLVLCVIMSLSSSCNGQALPLLSWFVSFFGEHEGPTYTVLRTVAPNIEKRLYPAQNWVCTEEFSTAYRSDDKVADMFRTLFIYNQGRNDMAKKIPMTIPINIQVDHRNGDLNAYQMCSYLPSDFQLNPPKPILSATSYTNLKIIRRSEMKVYSLQFGGFTTNSVFTQKMMELSNILKNNSLPYVEQELGPRALHFNNIYDAPTKIWNRRNEVWLLAPVKDV